MFGDRSGDTSPFVTNNVQTGLVTMSPEMSPTFNKELQYSLDSNYVLGYSTQMYQIYEKYRIDILSVKLYSHES